MNEQEAGEIVMTTYKGSFPVFTIGYYSLNVISNVSQLVDDFLKRFPVEEMSRDQIQLAFEKYVDEYVYDNFTDAHKVDYNCLFPWTTAPNCRFEEPYAIRKPDGSLEVFRDMNEWLEFVEARKQEAADCDTFEDFGRKLGVNLLMDL